MEAVALISVAAPLCGLEGYDELRFMRLDCQTSEPEVAEKARTSLMEKLKEAKEAAHKQNEQHMPKLNDKSLRPER